MEETFQKIMCKYVYTQAHLLKTSEKPSSFLNLKLYILRNVQPYGVLRLGLNGNI